ncbi:MAG: hypothetical protein RQ754_06665 [Desulfuromonadales bacterium]|nr:hypothetical protein [Desulfuromonadales bacterium]
MIKILLSVAILPLQLLGSEIVQAAVFNVELTNSTHNIYFTPC